MRQLVNINKHNMAISILLMPILCLLTGCAPVVMVGAAGSVMLFAKDRTAGETVDDIKIANAIRAQLIKKGFRELYTKIKLDVIQGRVLLTGMVKSEQDVLDTVTIVWNQEGVKEVINELKVTMESDHFNLFQYTKDTFITSQVKTKVLASPNIKSVNYTAITVNNIVYLFGIARSESEMKRVAELAANIRGVQKVISYIKPLERKAKNPNLEGGNQSIKSIQSIKQIPSDDHIKGYEYNLDNKNIKTEVIKDDWSD